ncbi:MAG: formylglycine-generating enzyme family protein [Planctomycetaceae bacterium]
MVRRLATPAVVAVILGTLAVPKARAVTIDWVTVGDAGNEADTTGQPNPAGAVNYAYRIGKYEVTIQQYTDFLNAVDPNGTNPYGLYNNSMGTNGNIRGILFSSGSASGQKYSPIGSPNRPITYVSWFDAARFANWMQNGQGSGSTETGAYTLVDGQTSGWASAKNPGATFYIPTENEWYKAAFYKGGSAYARYWDYAMKSNNGPSNSTSTDGRTNQANFLDGVYTVTQSFDYDSNQNYLTDVGAFTNSASYYGTFDQTGNVYEWNDLTGAAGSSRGLRGGGWNTGTLVYLSRFARGVYDPSYEFNDYGFRLASPASLVAVPEIDPAGMGSVLALVTGALGLIERRRKRA